MSISNSNLFPNKIKNYNIAIDGPSGSGKTTCGKKIAEFFNLKFLDTGVIYRLFTYFLITKNIDVAKLKKISNKLIKSFFVEFKNNHFFLNGEIIDIKKLYKFDVESGARIVAIFSNIRNKVTKICQEIIRSKNFLLVGRDAASVIAPNADVKIYLDISVAEQAKRKAKIFNSVHPENKINWTKFMKNANRTETTRPHGRLVQVPDALYLHNQDMTFEEVVAKLIKLIQQKLQLLPKIAIIGETNAGKSSLFNALARRKLTITSASQHTTRDQFEWVVNLDEKKSVVLIDSGGLSKEKNNIWQKEIDKRTSFLIKKADLILWVVNINENINSQTRKIQQLIGKEKYKTILVLNKSDLLKTKNEINWKQLGVPHIKQISVLQKIGLSELKQKIFNLLPENNVNNKMETENDKNKIIILGQVNSGKSSLFNLLGRGNQSLVSEIPHTTTNVVQNDTVHKNIYISLVDTGGIRKKNKKRSEIEIKSLTQTTSFLKYSDLALILVDLNAGSTVQDKKIVALVKKWEKPFILIGNKKDLLKENFLLQKKVFESFWSYLKKDMNIVYISTKNQIGIANLMKTILWKIKEIKNNK